MRPGPLIAALLAGLVPATAPVNAAFQIKLGQNVEREAFPFIAAIGLREANGTVQFFCTGSLIDVNNVVTAAHCLFDPNGRRHPDARLVVMIGQTDLLDFRSDRAEAVFRSVPHPDYDPGNVSNDIALIALAPAGGPAARTRRAAAAIPLAPAAPHAGAVIEVAGFGVSDEGKNQVQRRTRSGNLISAGQTSLQMARMPVVALPACQAALDKATDADGGARYRLGDAQMCAGLPTRSGDACQGDSGGPLVLRDTSGKARLVGLVSYGIGCGRDGLYGVYTRLGAYANWLKEAGEARKP